MSLTVSLSLSIYIYIYIYISSLSFYICIQWYGPSNSGQPVSETAKIIRNIMAVSRPSNTPAIFKYIIILMAVSHTVPLTYLPSHILTLSHTDPLTYWPSHILAIFSGMQDVRYVSFTCIPAAGIGGTTVISLYPSFPCTHHLLTHLFSPIFYKL